jgi:hypothetical protein
VQRVSEAARDENAMRSGGERTDPTLTSTGTPAKRALMSARTTRHFFMAYMLVLSGIDWWWYY